MASLQGQHTDFSSDLTTLTAASITIHRKWNIKDWAKENMHHPRSLPRLHMHPNSLKLQKEISPLMSPFSCRACSGGLFRISFFSRVFTLFLSVFSRLDVERGTAEGGKVNMEELEEEREEEEEVSARRSGPESRWEGMVVRMKSGRAGWRRRWDRTDGGIICHGGRVKM